MQQHVLMMRDRISCELGTRAGSVIINKTELSPQAACWRSPQQLSLVHRLRA